MHVLAHCFIDEFVRRMVDVDKFSSYYILTNESTGSSNHSVRLFTQSSFAVLKSLRLCLLNIPHNVG